MKGKKKMNLKFSCLNPNVRETRNQSLGTLKLRHDRKLKWDDFRRRKKFIFNCNFIGFVPKEFSNFSKTFFFFLFLFCLRYSSTFVFFFLFFFSMPLLESLENQKIFFIFFFIRKMPLAKLQTTSFFFLLFLSPLFFVAFFHFIQHSAVLRILCFRLKKKKNCVGGAFLITF